MKIGVSTLAVSPTPLESVLSCLEDRNVEYCEIMQEYPYSIIDRDVAESYKVKISIHAPLSDINIASYNDKIRRLSVSQIKTSIDTAVSVDSPVVVAHPGQIPVLGKKFVERIKEHSLESLRECSEYADENGVMLCIENMPDFDELLLKDLNEVKDVAEELDSNITLDVGHAHNMNFSVDEMLISPRIKHIHLSDNDGSYDSHSAIGSGDIDFKSLFKELKSINYDGILVVEVKDPSAVIESLDYIKNELNL